MTKQQFHALATANGCSSHYQGSTRIMFVFGNLSVLKKTFGKLDKNELSFSLMLQATSTN